MKPASFILAAICFSTSMMMFAIYERAVYFIGNDVCLNLVMFIITILLISATLGFIFDGLNLPDTHKENPK